jgi:hypothetical protein
MTNKTGENRVSNYQRILIATVIEEGSRSKAAEKLGVRPKTLEDALRRAFRALNVSNISDAHYLISKGIFSRKEMQESTEVQ